MAVLAYLFLLAFSIVSAVLTTTAHSAAPPLSAPAGYRFVVAAGCETPPRAPQIYQSCADQMALFTRVLAEAAAADRRLLVVFGANWCPSCRGLKDVLPSAKVLGGPALAGRVDVVEIAVSTLANGRVASVPSGEAVLAVVLAGRGDVKLRAIPFIAIIDPKSGRTVARNLDDLEAAGAWHSARLARVVSEAETEVMGGAKASGEPGWIRRKWLRWFGGS